MGIVPQFHIRMLLRLKRVGLVATPCGLLGIRKHLPLLAGLSLLPPFGQGVPNDPLPWGVVPTLTSKCSLQIGSSVKKNKVSYARHVLRCS